MLSRLKSFLTSGSKAVESSTARGAGRVNRRTSYQHNAAPPPQYFSPPPGATAGATGAGAPASKFDTAKIFRTGFLVLGAGFFLSRFLTDPNNPDSLMSRALNPRGRSRYVLKVEKLDDTIASYQSAFIGAERGMKPALLSLARYQVAKKMGVDLSSLTEEQYQALLSAGKFYRMIMEEHAKRIEEVKAKQLLAIRTHLDAHPSAGAGARPPRSEEEVKELIEGSNKANNARDNNSSMLIDDQLRAQLLSLLDHKIQAEVGFMKAIENILCKEQKTKLELGKDPTMLTKLKNALLGFDTGKYEFIMEKISTISLLPTYENPRVFVLNFKGDMMANQVSRLREEITAILNICDITRGDRVVVNLNSGGGTVTGYGLGAAQLLRLKQAGLHLTVAVDEVAASGGYLMASVADRIIASPFALLGSVGVVATIPNVSERLQREGISVEDVTAGKYKRTLTFYKKPKDEDRAKVKSDVESVLVIFKDFLKRNRPSLDVETIATGETWHGPEAKRLGLVDELMTSDDLLMQLRQQGAEVYAVNLKPVAPRFADAFEDDQHAMLDEDSSIFTTMKSWAVRWISSVVRSVVQETVLGNSGATWPTSSGGTLDQYLSGGGNVRYDYPSEINQRILAMDTRSNPPMI